MAIITISRLTGSGGREIATATAEALNFQLIDRSAMDAVIDQQFPVRTEQLSRIKKDRRVYDEMMRSAIAEVAAAHNVVILVSGAHSKGIEAKPVELPPQLREDILTTKLDVAQMADLAEPAEDKLPEFAH